MAHARSTIMNEIEALINTGTATVKRTRGFPTNAENLPRFNLYFRREVIDWGQSTTQGTYRIMTIMIEALVNGSSETVEGLLQAQSEYLEERLMRPRLTADVVDALITETEFDTSENAESVIGMASLTFQVEYRTTTDEASDLT